MPWRAGCILGLHRALTCHVSEPMVSVAARSGAGSCKTARSPRSVSHSASRGLSRRSWLFMGACPVSAGIRTPLRWAFCSRAKSKGGVNGWRAQCPRTLVRFAMSPSPARSYPCRLTRVMAPPRTYPCVKGRIGFLLCARTHKRTQGAKAAKPSDTGPERIEKSRSGEIEAPC